MNKDGNLPENREAIEREENTTYTGDISVADDGEFTGRDRIEGDQYNGDVYREPEDEYPVDDRDTLTNNTINWLLSLFSEELLYNIYERVDSLPLRLILLGYSLVVGSVSFFSLISTSTIMVHYQIILLPFLPMLAAILFKWQMELFSCPSCGPFTIRTEKSKILGKPLMKVEYTCSECGEVVDSERYELESQNRSPVK